MSDANSTANRDTPEEAVGGGFDADVVPGDPVVPITVWRTPHGADERATAIPARLAQRLIAAYTRPAEAIVDLTDSHVLAAPALASGRSCHRAWFTDASSVIIGPPAATTPRRNPAKTPRGRAPRRDRPVTGAASLVAATWPLGDQPASSHVRLAHLLAASREILRPGGCLVLLNAHRPAPPRSPEDFTDVVAAARRVGLTYLQHIVAVHADVAGDQFVYHADDHDLAALADEGAAPVRAHLPVHADLFVFTRPGGGDD